VTTGSRIILVAVRVTSIMDLVALLLAAFPAIGDVDLLAVSVAALVSRVRTIRTRLALRFVLDLAARDG
jgi:hypothetical protein